MVPSWGKRSRCSRDAGLSSAGTESYSEIEDIAAVMDAAGGAFGEFPDPSPEEAAARQVMRDHFAHREQVSAAAGGYATAETDVRAWGPGLDPHQLRKMIGYALGASGVRTHRARGIEATLSCRS